MAAASWTAGPRVAGAGGVEIATWDLGGDGPPLLMVHGTGFHARVWRAVAGHLAGWHRCWAVDLRGHGASGHAPDGEYTDWGCFVEDVVAAVDALGLAGGPLVGVGHSLGAAVVLMAEQRHPGLFSSVYGWEPIVLSPTWRRRMGEGGGTDLAEVARRRRSRFASRAEARDNYAGKPPFDRFDPEVLDDYVEHGLVDAPAASPQPGEPGGVVLACPPEEEASTYRGAPLTDAWERLPDVGVPVVIAAGAPGASPPAAMAAELAGRLPSGRLERHADLDHFGPMTHPGWVAASVLAFTGRSS